MGKLETPGQRCIRLLVCGGRDFTDYELMVRTLYAMCDSWGLWSEPDSYGNKMPCNLTIIHGRGKGADLLADQWAVVNWVPIEEYPADWETHGKRAGPIRNQKMLDEGKPNYVVAFPGGRGTADMIRRARKAGVPVIEILKEH